MFKATQYFQGENPRLYKYYFDKSRFIGFIFSALVDFVSSAT